MVDQCEGSEVRIVTKHYKLLLCPAQREFRSGCILAEQSLVLQMIE